MAELRTLSTWILRLVTTLLCLSLVSSDDASEWDKQMKEMKAMMMMLDSKITSMDSRLSNLNVLKYAFEINSLDTSMRVMNTRVDQIATQIDSIKESLRNLPSSPCTETPRTQSPQHSRSTSVSEDNLALKLDDYGKKLIQSHQSMKSSHEEHHQSLSDFIEVVRSGFAKVIAKVDSFLSLEGQMSTIVPLVRQLSAATSFISDEVTSVATSVTEVKTSVTDLSTSARTLENQMSGVSPLVRQLSDAIVGDGVTNMHADIAEIKRDISNFTNTNKALENFVTEVKNSIAFPVLGLGQALEESKQLQSQMSQLHVIENKVVKATTLSSRLLAKEGVKSLPSEEREIAQNLTKFLSEIQNDTTPLFLSLSYEFDHIQALMGDAFSTLANRTQCRLDESMKLQIAKLRETFAKPKEKTSETPRSDDIFAYCSDTIEDLVLQDTTDLTLPLRKLLSQLQILVAISEKSQSLESDTLDWDKSLRSLLG